MFIKMKETTPGSPDGFTIKKYEAGETYDLPEKLAKGFISMAVADKADVKPSRKSATPPKNKATQPESNKKVEEVIEEDDSEAIEEDDSEDSMDDMDEILSSGNVKKSKKK